MDSLDSNGLPLDVVAGHGLGRTPRTPLLPTLNPQSLGPAQADSFERLRSTFQRCSFRVQLTFPASVRDEVELSLYSTREPATWFGNGDGVALGLGWGARP